VAQRRLRSPVAAAQELLERVAEVARTQAVDERIRCRVAVAEPEENVEENLGRTLATERLGQVDGEERRPADDETTDDDADCLGGFLLFVETAQLRDDVQLSEARSDQRRTLLRRRRN